MQKTLLQKALLLLDPPQPPASPQLLLLHGWQAPQGWEWAWAALVAVMHSTLQAFLT
jgi:hypothetical protein